MTEFMKHCRRCQVLKVLDDYYADPRNRDGRRSECKGCYLNSRREAKREYSREYVQRPDVKERNAIRMSARRASIRSHRNDWTPELVRDTWLKQKCACAICGIIIGRNCHKDHIIPIARGGWNKADNLQLLCGTCNRVKKDKLCK